MICGPRRSPIAKPRWSRSSQARPPNGVLRYSAHFETSGETLLRKLCALGAEGIVSKRIDKPYHSGRSRDWYKAKCANRQEFVVIGFAPSTATPKAIGSLALGYYERRQAALRGPRRHGL